MSTIITKDGLLHVVFPDANGLIHWWRSIERGTWMREYYKVKLPFTQYSGLQLRLPVRNPQQPLDSFNNLVAIMDRACNNAYLIYQQPKHRKWQCETLTDDSKAFASFHDDPHSRATGFVWQNSLFIVVPCGHSLRIGRCSLPRSSDSPLQWEIIPIKGDSPFTGCPQVLVLNESIHIFARTRAGSIWNYCTNLNEKNGTNEHNWQLTDIFEDCTQNEAVESHARPAQSDPQPVARLGSKSGRITIHLFYHGIDNRLRELIKRQKKPWKHVSLRYYVRGLDEIGGSVAVCYLEQTHVFFLSKDSGHVQEIMWKNAKREWKLYDISQAARLKCKVTQILSIAASSSPHLIVSTESGDLVELVWYHKWLADFISVNAEPNIRQNIAQWLGITVTSSNNIESDQPPPPPPPPPPPTQKSLPTTQKTEQKVPKPLVVNLPFQGGPLPPTKLKDKRKVRLVIVSDTHNHADAIPMPDGDILVHAGDFTVNGFHDEIVKFRDWLRRQPYKHKIVVQGNHEYKFSLVERLLKDDCHVLGDNMISVEGINFYGTKWHTDYSSIPPQTDILITHSPPVGHGDIIYTGESRGNKKLADTITRIKIKLVIFGHNHEGYGVTYDENTTYINAATCVGGANSMLRRQAIVCDFYPELKHLYTGLVCDDEPASCKFY